MRSPSCLELCLALSIGLVPAAAAAEDAAPRVAVVIDTAVNLDHGAQVQLAEQVADALRRALVVDVAGGREVDRRLAPMQLPEGCFREPACQRKVAGICCEKPSASAPSNPSSPGLPVASKNALLPSP